MRLLVTLIFLTTGSAGCLPPVSSTDGGVQDAGTAPPATYLIVSADELLDAAEAFADYRAERGQTPQVHSLSSLVGDDVTYEALVARVHALIQESIDQLDEGMPVFLLLLGDAPGLLPAQYYLNPQGNCDSDNGYADLDGDQIPDIPVGRVPARSNEQALAYLAKVQAHESSYRVGEWNKRIILYTGEGGYGQATDASIESLVMQGARELMPGFDVIGLYNNPASAYYYTPFDNKVIDLFNAGSIMTIYLGHGDVRVNEGLSVSQVSALSCPDRSPFAFFFACNNGEFTSSQLSLAEAVLWQEAGPVASLGSSEVSHPYGNAIFSYEVERAVLTSQPATVGEALVLAKEWVMTNNSDPFRSVINNFAILMGLTFGDQIALKQQHLSLYNLLGDPATSLMLPGRNVVSSINFEGIFTSPGYRISGRAEGLGAGTARVAIETARDEIHHELAPVDPEAPDPVTVQANWALAVDKVVVSAEVAMAADGTFEATLTLPDGLDPALELWATFYASDGVNDATFGTQFRSND